MEGADLGRAMDTFTLLRGLFPEAPPPVVRQLASGCDLRWVDEGDILVRAGAPQSHVVFLAEGRMALYRRNKKRGVALLLGLLEAPSVFGDAECMVAGIWSVSARAVKDSACVMIPNQRFVHFVKDQKEVLWQLYKDACARHLIANYTAQTLALYDVETRLLRLLLDFAHRFGRIADDTAEVGRALSGSDLAAALGVTRRTVTRAVGQLQRRGVLSRDPDSNEFRIHDLGDLSRELPRQELGVSSRFGEAPLPVLLRYGLGSGEED